MVRTKPYKCLATQLTILHSGYVWGQRAKCCFLVVYLGLAQIVEYGVSRVRVLVLVFCALALSSCATVNTQSVQSSLMAVMRVVQSPFSSDQNGPSQLGLNAEPLEVVSVDGSKYDTFAPTSDREDTVLFQPVQPIEPEPFDSIFMTIDAVDEEDLDAVNQAYTGPMNIYAQREHPDVFASIEKFQIDLARLD